MNRDTKQVIVMRTHYPNSKGGLKTISKGKMVAQGAHASLSFLTKSLTYIPNPVLDYDMGYRHSLRRLSEAEKHWLENSFAKVCLKVKTEEELMEVYNKAKEAGLTVHLITDSGRTEFDGVPTKTCIAIGPDWVDKFEGVTSDLQMMN